MAPFPAGLNDCVSGSALGVAHADELGIDPARIVVAGESGGGNLTLATGLALKRDGDLGLIKGLYALCPYIAGQWPAPDSPSSIENEGILLRLHNNRGRHGLRHRGVRGPQPAGLALLRTRSTTCGASRPPSSTSTSAIRCATRASTSTGSCWRPDVPARCRQMMGTMHGTEIFAIACPDISRDTARDIAAFATRLTPPTGLTARRCRRRYARPP